MWPGQQSADARWPAACVLDASELDAGVAHGDLGADGAVVGGGDRVGLCLAVVDGGGVTGSFLRRPAEIS